jgi:hypothetical protein
VGSVGLSCTESSYLYLQGGMFSIYSYENHLDIYLESFDINRRIIIINE